MKKTAQITGKRKPGRPKKGEAVMTRDKLTVLNRMYLRGKTQKQMSVEMGVSLRTVQHHITKSLRPLWKQGLTLDRDLLLAEIEELKTTAWSLFESDAPAETLEMIKEAVSEPAKPTKSKTKARLNIVERATRTLRKDYQTAWLHIIEWCISERAKIIGAYAQRDDVTEVAPQIVSITITTREEAAEARITFEEFRKRASAALDN